MSQSGDLSSKDSINGFFEDLRKKDTDQQIAAAKAIKSYIESEGRNAQVDHFARFMNDVCNRIFDIVNTGDSHELFGGICLIDELIEVPYCQMDETIVIKFASYLRWALKPAHYEVQILELVSSTLGHLVRTVGPLTQEIVEFEVKRALEWLEGSAYEFKKHAAVLFLKELAENAPTLFNVHVANFLDHIWVALRDPKLVIREGAVSALRACLRLIAKRDTRQRVQWYFQVYNETSKGFKAATPGDIHGSLLTIGELLQNSGEFMLARFKEICERVLKYRDHRDRMVAQTVISLLPRLAAFCPDNFIRGYLDMSLEHILSVLKENVHREVAYRSLGELAVAVGEHIGSRLRLVMPIVRDGLTARGTRRPFSPSALICVSMLAEAVGPELQPHIHGLLDQMFSNGLSPELITALSGVTKHIPKLYQEVQERLASTVSRILRARLEENETLAQSATRKDEDEKKRMSISLSSLSSKPQPEASPAPVSEHNDALIALALKTLGNFDVNGSELLPFVRTTVAPYLDNDTSSIRKQATITCALLLRRVCLVQRPNRAQKGIIAEVLERLLRVGIADSDAEIRETVLRMLDTRFDRFLAQADNLRSLFVVLNDEVFTIRTLAMDVIGRLARRNPAYVMPSLRRTLIQLLTEIEYSTNAEQREQATQLLGHMISSAHSLIFEYVEPIIKVLLSKLHDPDPHVVSKVLAAIGRLSLVARDDMKKYKDRILPFIVETLEDRSSPISREDALQSLGQLVSSTGMVIEPYNQYKKLLPTILGLLGSEHPWTVRKEAIRTLGKLGALDPFQHKQNERALNSQRQQKHLTDLHPTSLADSKGLTTSDEDYYSTVAINALMEILEEQGLTSFHNLVISSLMFIFQRMQMGSVQFLKRMIPPFLKILARKYVRSSQIESEEQDPMFNHLTKLVSIVKQNIRPYLKDIFQLVHSLWKSRDPKVLQMTLRLVEEISMALKEEFKAYVPELIPLLLPVLHNDRSVQRLSSLQVLHALEVFGPNLEDHLFLVVPSLVKLCEQVIDTPRSVRLAVICTIGRLSMCLDFSSYTSRIVHPLVRILDGSDNILRDAAMNSIACLLFQTGSEFAIFLPVIEKVTKRHQIHHQQYSLLVSKLLRNEPFLARDFSLPKSEDSKTTDHKQALEDSLKAISDSGTGSSSSKDSNKGNNGNSKENVLPLAGSMQRLQVNQTTLKKASNTSQRATKDDFLDWFRSFTVELLKESPMPALRSCEKLAQKYHPLGRELFNPAFISCWNEIVDQLRDELVDNFEQALKAPNLPQDVLHTLLKLAEFMEHDNIPLPIDIRTLGTLAETHHSYAKALHYKEIEFRTSPNTTIEALISINNKLQQPESAVGILEHAQLYHNIELKESWYEKLQRWEDALEAYERKQLEEPDSVPVTLGRMRALSALGEWERLSQLSEDLWNRNEEPTVRRRVSPLAATAAWNLGRWDKMEMYADNMNEDDLLYREGSESHFVADGPFFKAVLAAHQNEFDAARIHITKTRELLDVELTALVNESYNRAYRVITKVQQLTELEEVIHYKEIDLATSMSVEQKVSERCRIRDMWSRRLNGCQDDVEVWQDLLAVRSLVVQPQEDIPTWLRFSTLCRKSGRVAMSLRVLTSLLGCDPAEHPGQRLPTNYPQVTFAYLEHIWHAGFKEKSLSLLPTLIEELHQREGNRQLMADCYLKLAEWKTESVEKLHDAVIPEVLSALEKATQYDHRSYKTWHAWALMNYQIIVHYENKHDDKAHQHLVPAIRGFVQSIVHDQSGSGPVTQLQDVLRLLNLWFKYGSRSDVNHALNVGFENISVDTWLAVIPQIIARIDTSQPRVRDLILLLLANVGKHHPQALIYPLTVAAKSQVTARKEAALTILTNMKQHSARLVEQASFVSNELIRVAILWHESWHESLEEASRLWFGQTDIEGMFKVLDAAHARMDEGPDTIREVAFQQAYGRDLQEAQEWCRKYRRSKKDSDLNQAWELYCIVFRKINKQLPQLVQSDLELQYVSPRLLHAKSLTLAVPGTYHSGKPLISIDHFKSTLKVIDSKQRPRRLSIYGSDGRAYDYLLKGHEDLRQDERVMQLFGLVNTLFKHDPETQKRDLGITTYSVIPLATDSGLIEWIPNCDTLHALIKEYRDSRKVIINVEHRLIASMSADYQSLTLMQKVEVFEYALKNTTGNDLSEILWLKAMNSETWLERRTTYTRSLAVMCMVGYILGLGDRHPCNLMIDRTSGKLIHIDFGDCFEVAMHREKFPEKVPFRLTRMLVNAMEVSQIEGLFRGTCVSVMRVLRENKESLMAVLEAFVYDPLINWRLLNTESVINNPRRGSGISSSPAAKPPLGLPVDPKLKNDPLTADRPRRSLSTALAESASMQFARNSGSDALNSRAVTVINRVSNKLTGKDFENETLDVRSQVQRLIEQARSLENLCQCYIGWCPLW